MILDRNACMSADDTEYDVVEVPEWGPRNCTEVATVRVRSLNGDQRTRAFARANLDDKATMQPGYWRALVCAMGMVDAHGAYLFPNEQEGATILGRKHPEVIERISGKILEMSNMTKASREALEKKLQETTTSSGGTSSPEQSTPVTGSESTA